MPNLVIKRKNDHSPSYFRKVQCFDSLTDFVKFRLKPESYREEGTSTLSLLSSSFSMNQRAVEESWSFNVNQSYGGGEKVGRVFQKIAFIHGNKKSYPFLPYFYMRYFYSDYILLIFDFVLTFILATKRSLKKLILIE